MRSLQDKLSQFRDQAKIQLLAGPEHDTKHILGIMRNVGKGDCLFHALSQCDILTQMDHKEIRTKIVDYATTGKFWEEHGTSMMQQHLDQISLFRKEGTTSEEQQNAYKEYMSRPQMYGTAAELQIASLCWQFNFSILTFQRNGFLHRLWKWKRIETYDVSNEQSQDNTDEKPWYYFRFSGNPSAGHWERLFEISLPVGVRRLPVGRFINTEYDYENNMMIYKQEILSKDSDQGQRSKDVNRDESFTSRKPLAAFPSLHRHPSGGHIARVRDAPSKKAYKRSKSSSNGPASPLCSKCKVRSRRSKKKSCSQKKRKSTDGRRKKLDSKSSDPDSSKSCTGSRKKSKKNLSDYDESESEESSGSGDEKYKPPTGSKSSFCKKRVLITGGTNGLGKELVRRFYEAGAIVFVIDTEDELLEDLANMYPGIVVFHVDHDDWDENQHCVDSAGPLDHLVNNAGYLYPKRILDIENRDALHAFEINVFWLLGISIQFARGIIYRKCSGGTIVNVSSMFDRFALPGGALYSCSQAALSNLTRCLAVELGRHNIRVNTVKPFLLSNGIEDRYSKYCDQGTTQSTGRYLREMEDRALLQEPMIYDHVCDTIMYLLGPTSRSITGTEVSVQSGMMEY